MSGEPSSPRPGGDAGRRHGRRESVEERADRLWAELLQEVRVAQTGVQILLAFLLTIPFTQRYELLGPADRSIYVVTVLLGAFATGALIAPVSFHRIVTGHGLKVQSVRWASRFTFAGLVLLLAMVTSAVLLILRFVTDNALAVWLTCTVLAWFTGCWFLPAAWTRHRSRRQRPRA